MHPQLPHRADHVGSLLRPEALRQARLQYKNNSLDLVSLREIENNAIKSLVQAQIQTGLKAITDGEARRDYWHLDFLCGLHGISLKASEGMAFKGVSEIPPTAVVEDKIQYQPHPMLAHYRFLHAQVPLGHTAKFTIPSPAMAHMRGGSQAIPKHIYPKLEQYWQDLAAAYQAAIADFYAAGCRYLQIDDITFAYLADPKVQAMCRDHGDDPMQLHQVYAEVLQQALSQRPKDMLITMHTCRGNFQSTWVAAEPYQEAIVKSLFSCPVDAFFMEFDSERAGGFDILQHLPADKHVVLGLITSKTGTLEDPQHLITRIEQAAQQVPLERLALSPQCGFSSTHHGNHLSEAEQWAKLAHVVKVANAVWKQ